jgi:hypothetical protein
MYLSHAPMEANPTRDATSMCWRERPVRAMRSRDLMGHLELLCGASNAVAAKS